MNWNFLDGSILHMLTIRLIYTVFFCCVLPKRRQFSWRAPIAFVFWVLLAMGTESLAESVARMLCLDKLQQPLLQALAGWFLIVLFGFGVYRLMVRKPHGRKSKTTFPKPLFFLIVILLLLMFSMIDTQNNVVYPQCMESFRALMTVLALCLLYIFEVEYHLRDDYRQLDELLEKDRLRYEAAREYTNLINMKFHDIKHQIHKIKQEQYVDSAYLQELEQALYAYDSDLHTGNAALDIILTEKLRQCAECGIELTVIADGQKLRCITASDIYSIFGNLLDNAMDAVKQLPETQMRQISLTVTAQSGVTRIRIQNYFTGELKTEGEKLLTTKADSTQHGFGMMSVGYIVEKYAGVLKVEQAENIFTVHILIPFCEELA